MTSKAASPTHQARQADKNATFTQSTPSRLSSVTCLAWVAAVACWAAIEGWSASPSSPRDLLIQSVRAPEVQREGYLRALADCPAPELAAQFAALLDGDLLTEQEKVLLMGHLAMHPVPDILAVFDRQLLAGPVSPPERFRTALQIRSEHTASLSPAVALSILRRALDQEDDIIRVTGFLFIGHLASEDAQAVIRRTWGDASPMIRQLAFQYATIFLPLDDVLAKFKGAMKLADLPDRITIMMAALRLQSPEANSLVAKALSQERSEDAKLAFLETFQSDSIYGEGAELVLTTLMKDASPAVREAALLAGAQVNLPFDWSMILLASRQPSPAVRVLAAQRAADGTPAKSHALALSLTRDPDPAVRAEAARTLFTLGQTDIDREVFRLSADASPLVRQHAWAHLAECHEHVMRRIIQNVLVTPDGPLQEITSALQTIQRMTLLHAELAEVLANPQYASRAQALLPLARMHVPQDAFRWIMASAGPVAASPTRLTLLFDVLTLVEASGPPSKEKERALLWMEELLAAPTLAGRDRLLSYLQPWMFRQRPTLRTACLSLAFGADARLRGLAWGRLHADRGHPQWTADLLKGLRVPAIRAELLGSLTYWIDGVAGKPDEPTVVRLILDELLLATTHSSYVLQQGLSRLTPTLAAAMLHDRLSPTTSTAVLQRVLPILVTFQDPRSLALVKSWVIHASPPLRQAAVTRLGEAREWPPLLPLRRDPDLGVRTRVWEFLLGAPAADCLPWLMEVFRQPLDPNDLAWRLTLMQLFAGRQSPPTDDPAKVTEAWAELLTQPHPALRLTALRYLIQWRGPGVEDLLLSLIERPTEDPELRGEALIGLVQRQAHHAVPRLLALKETGPLRLAALWAIARLSHPRSVEALLTALAERPDDAITLLVLQGLGWQRRQWNDAVEHAVWALAEAPKDFSKESIAVRLAAIEALGLEPEDRWLTRLAALLHDPVPDVQEVAMRAISRLAGSEAENILGAYADRVQGTPREQEARQILAARQDQKPRRFVPHDPFAHLTPLQRLQAEREGPGDVVDPRLGEWRMGKTVESPEFQGAAIRKPRPSILRAWDALTPLAAAGQWDQAVRDALALWEEAEPQEMGVTTLTHAVGLKTQLADWFRRLPPAGQQEFRRQRAELRSLDLPGHEGHPAGPDRGALEMLDAGEWTWARARLARADAAPLARAQAWLNQSAVASVPHAFAWGPIIPLQSPAARGGWTPLMEPRAGFPLQVTRPKADGPASFSVLTTRGTRLRGLPAPGWSVGGTIDGLQWVEGHGWIAHGALTVLRPDTPPTADVIAEHEHAHRVTADQEARHVIVLDHDVRPLLMPHERPLGQTRRIRRLDPRTGEPAAERELPRQFDVFSPLTRTPWGVTWVAAERQAEATRFWCFGLTDDLDWSFPPLLLGALHEPPTPVLAWEVGCFSDGQRLYTWLPNGWVIGVNPFDGSMSWATRVAKRSAFWVPEWTPAERQGLSLIHQAVSSGRLVATVNPTYDEIWGLDSEHGRPLWSLRVPERSRVLDVLDDLVLVESPRQVQAIDGRTGQPVWTRPLAASRAGFGAVQGGTIFVLSGSELVTIRARTGEVLQRLPLPRGERGYHLSVNGESVWLISPVSVLPLTLTGP